MTRRHPVVRIIHDCQKRGLQPPDFRDIGGTPNSPNGISWWVRVCHGGAWSHVLFLGKRQFVDGVEL